MKKQLNNSRNATRKKAADFLKKHSNWSIGDDPCCDKIDLEAKNSKLHKTVKGIKNGVSIAQDIAKGYNDIAQWAGLPQVPKPFWKSS